MAATGILAEAVTATKTALTALGLKPVTDPRNARPLSVMIELHNLGGNDFGLRYFLGTSYVPHW